jgi:hypothetical protein
MKTNKVWLWIAGIAGIAGVAYIFIKGSNKQQDAKKIEVKNTSNELQKESKPEEKDGSLEGVVKNVSNAVISSVLAVAGGWMKYKVNTQQTGLNVRKSPDGSSQIVATLPKDSVVYGRSSKIIGWMEVSRDGKKSIGYSSSAFLTSQK